MINRKKEIQKKFSVTRNGNNSIINNNEEVLESHNLIDFSKIKIGIKTVEDAIVELEGSYRKSNPRLGDKLEVLKAINNNDLRKMREISDYFYRVSGIYSRLCRYMSYFYRYDWFLTPYINSNSIKKENILSDFKKSLMYLDNSEIKKFLGDTALKVIRYGCYYGYLIFLDDRIVVQELPIEYCRSRYSIKGKPTVEFDMRFFDYIYTDVEQREKILNLFPPEFKKGYMKYSKGKLERDFISNSNSNSWYLLDPDYAIKFNMNGEDFPAFISVIPSIIDLDDAQALDRKKMQQQLLKLIIQKLPLDKNGDLIFDPDEVRDLHNNAVAMLGKAIGLDVLTTFADVNVADMADKSLSSGDDDLVRVERSVYNEAGVSQMQFNTDGNIALEKSILNDEATIYNLLLQFENFLNEIIKPLNKNTKKIYYKVQLLTTTIYNYKEMSKLYKEQTQLGYSKMLPQIALGQSQSSILANAHFENDILDLIHLFIPPLMSSTMSADVINNGVIGEKKVGRNEKPDDQKSEKTIKNKESKN